MSKENSKQFAVLGLGTFGLSVAVTFSENGYEVLGVDRNHEIVQEAAELITHSLVADISDERSMHALGIGNFDVVVIATGESFEATILGTLIAKESGAGYVLVKARDEIQAKILKKIGADRIVRPEMEMGEKIAYSLISEKILDYIAVSENYSLVEINPLADWHNKKIKDINMRAVYGISIVTLKRGEEVLAIIDPDMKILEGDVLIALCDQHSIRKFFNETEG